MADLKRTQPGPDGDSDAQTTMHVRRAIGGDVDSLGWVVERLSPLLSAHACYRLGPALRVHHDPEDLVHEAWLVTLPKLSSLPARDGRYTPVLLKFLSTTVLHRVRNLMRRHLQGRPVRRTELLEESRDLLAEIPAAQSGVVSRAVRREVQNEVRRLIDDLEEQDREILILRGIEQQTNATVGVLLEISTEAVSKRYRRALEKLRARLPGSVFEEFDAA